MVDCLCATGGGEIHWPILLNLRSAEDIFNAIVDVALHWMKTKMSLFVKQGGYFAPNHSTVSCRQNKLTNHF